MDECIRKTLGGMGDGWDGRKGRRKKGRKEMKESQSYKIIKRSNERVVAILKERLIDRLWATLTTTSMIHV